MSKVWIVNDGRSINFRNLDLTDARTFGQIVMIGNTFLFPDQIGPNDTILPEVLDPLQTAAEDFDTQQDYLLPIGDVVQIAQFVVLIARRFHNIPNIAGIRTLRWDKQANSYYVVKLAI